MILIIVIGCQWDNNFEEREGIEFELQRGKRNTLRPWNEMPTLRGMFRKHVCNYHADVRIQIFTEFKCIILMWKVYVFLCIYVSVYVREKYCTLI